MADNNIVIYNELLDAYLNHYNNLYNVMNSERGLSLLEFNKLKGKLRAKIEDIMKHFLFAGNISTANIVRIDTIAHTDALKTSKTYFDLEEENPQNDSDNSNTTEESYNTPVIYSTMTKANLLHRYKIIYDKYVESFSVCKKQSAIESMQRSLEAELKVVTEHAIEVGLDPDIVNIAFNEAKELWGKY